MRPKKRGSRTGFMVDPFRWVTIWYESGLEEEVLYSLVASPDVERVEEQQRILYRDADGAPRHYTSDFRVTWRSGTVSTIEAKYHARALARGTRERLAFIGERATSGGTDNYRVVTERHLDKVMIANSREIVSCALDDDALGTARVRQALGRMPSSAPLGDVADATGLGFRGYRAAVALLQSGALRLPGGVRISPDAVAEVRP